MKLDELHLSILKELESNARQSFAELGRKVGLSSSAVAERVQKLEEEGIITGYYPKLNYAKLGYDTIAIVTIKLGFGKSEPFKKIVAQWKEVKECFIVTGDDCFYLKVVLKNNAQLVDLLNRLTQHGETKTAIILSELKQGV